MISKAELEQMYLDKAMTYQEIGEVIGVSKSTVCEWMKKYSIKSHINITKLSNEELDRMYWNEEMTQREIAKYAGVSQGTVRNWMILYEIPCRDSCPLVGKYIKMPMVSKAKVEEMYLVNKMSQIEIAKEFGVYPGDVCAWMKKYDIRARVLSEALIGKFAGENNPQWMGGISFEPYCHKFNNKFKEAVRKRDDFTCQLCGYEQKLGGRKLDVHHIHYDKSNCWPDVVALCHSCNSRVNSDRDYWEHHFENLLSGRRMLNWTDMEMI